jgi:hypothetical protein
MRPTVSTHGLRQPMPSLTPCSVSYICGELACGRGWVSWRTW